MSRQRTLTLSLLLCGAALAPAQAVLAQDNAAPAATAADDTNSPIIVTGTRSANRKALDSVSPIDVYSPESLKQAGETNLSGALAQISPAVSAMSYGQDVGALVSSIRLHGLSPDQTLVLVNGKRRHNSGYLYASPGPIQGSSPADLDLIPMSAVDHIELLRDGASAQYGSDAISGVINIILKNANHGGSLEVQGGGYADGGGETLNGSGNVGFALPNNGFVNLSADVHYNDYTDRDGPDNRFGNRYVDKAFGAPLVSRQSVGLNAVLPIGDKVELYTFDTYAHRLAKSFGFYRVLPGVYGDGYSPNTVAKEDDFSATAGLRGEDLAGFHWDLSSTYGYDNIHVNMDTSANPSLYAATGATPTSFYLGSYRSTEWTNNLDLTRPIDIGLVEPVNLALGGEYRRNGYTLEAGDPASYYGSGSSASPGLPPTSAGTHHRNVFAGYGELDFHLTHAWEVDFAGRVEHYSDVGTNGSWKVSTRYEISRALAVRGTYNTAFRAPTLAQEYYSNLGVSPSAASGQLAVNSEAARLLGATALKPEKSKNASIGLVITPTSKLHFTIDAYQIKIDHRIAAGGSYSGQTALDALRVGGYSIPSTVSMDAVTATYFANVANTRTRGIDVTADYVQDLGDAGALNWSFAAEVNRNKVSDIQNDANGVTLLNQMQKGWLRYSQPADKETLGVRWKKGPFDIGAQEVRWGPLQDYVYYTSGPNAFSSTTFVSFHQKARYTTNLSASWQAKSNLKLTVGGENITNTYPKQMPAIASLYGVTKYDYNNTQIGLNGAFVYGKVGFSF